MELTDGFLVDFPTLGDIGEAWVRRHCRVPDGYRRGSDFVWSDWQFWCGAKYYEIRPGVEWGTGEDGKPEPLFNQAFVYRRAQVVAPQKTGKGPWAASMACLEAVGPSQFLGWAEKGDGYACSDWGCGCGWEYEYLPGEPMGMRHPSPVIQLTANNEDQVGNVYRPLTAMIRLGPLSDLMSPREGFIRIAGEVGGDDFDRIDAVTSSARGRLGNPVSWVLHDETGMYTVANKMVGVAETQRRGAAGMGGRTMETTNAWDPSENSTAQRTYESQAPDIFKFYRIPPKGLSWGNKRDRRKILKYVYAGSPWVNLDSIEAEAMELNERDPAQAERFFGNRLVYGQGSWLRDGLWEDRYAEDRLAAQS
ncbi:terminase [Rhodococcus sp. AH-ZY2]|uniref:terminase n=1 Tax=Rhodococcus sp. AH-ZY2 TaxID=3047468 RepID=UPI0027E02E15|nr:terminase [Rhodococcus sp. AH-ZY2]WML63646.1 terminase [Rhodococcus sp. AH-ZY2]